MTEKIRILSQREEDVTNAFNEGFDVFCIANEETITKYKNTPEFLLKTCTTGRIIPIGSFGSIADHNNFF